MKIQRGQIQDMQCMLKFYNELGVSVVFTASFLAQQTYASIRSLNTVSYVICDHVNCQPWSTLPFNLQIWKYEPEAGLLCIAGFGLALWIQAGKWGEHFQVTSSQASDRWKYHHSSIARRSLPQLLPTHFCWWLFCRWGFVSLISLTRPLSHNSETSCLPTKIALLTVMFFQLTWSK